MVRPQLRAMRRGIVRSLPDRCKAQQPGEYGPPDPVTGKVTRLMTTIWEGPCLVRPSAEDPRNVEAAAQNLKVTDYNVSLPAKVNPVGATQITVTSCPGDPALKDVVLFIKGVELDAWHVTRRVIASTVG